MDRRTFLRGVGGLGVTAAIAGCMGILGGGGGGGGVAPPRKSSVFEAVRATDGQLLVELESPDSIWVESRAEVDAALRAPDSGGDPLGALGDAVGSLNPIGVASAQKGGRGGRGATGRGRSSGGVVPTGTHGRKKYHGDDDEYEEWREDNENEIRRYRDVTVAEVGYARIGEVTDEEEELPGVGTVPWDRTADLAAGESAGFGIDRQGWYRAGSRLTADGGSHDFGWESVDAQVRRAGDGFEVESKWKMSPRL
jgi:hypothetical protein